MLNIQTIKTLLEKRIFNTDIFIVDISIKPYNKIFITLDTSKNITIDKCAEISRYIEANLDRNTEDYSVEVSSPGLNQPFKVFKQYEKATGKVLEIITIDGQKKRGKLISVNPEQLSIEDLISKNLFVIPFSQIKTTKYII